MSRLDDVVRFYRILSDLEARHGTAPCLRDCDGRRAWPRRGVYFFYEGGEARSTSGSGPRVVRVGTHAVSAGSKTSLWDRLSQHRGAVSSGSGNHRGSIFRLLVGEALIRRDGIQMETWSVGQSLTDAAGELGIPKEEIKAREAPIEAAVSRAIGAMPFLWVGVDDAPGPASARAFIERNSIALLANGDRDPIDTPSTAWLGRHSGRDRVYRSGLWNYKHVEERYEPSFLDVLERHAERTDGWSCGVRRAGGGAAGA